MSLSTSGEKSEKLSNEGIVLSLRSDMARMAAKYKTRISKLVESRNSLIQENKTLTLRLQEFSKTPERSKSPTFSIETSENRPNSYKLLGKFANNIKKVENSLNRSPRPSSSEALQKYLQLTPSHNENLPISTPLNQKKKENRQTKDQVDLLLEDQTLNIEIPFLKESEGVYSFGSKRVFIKVESGKLFIRIGAGFLTLEEFLKIYLPLEIEKKNRAGERKVKEKLVTCFGVQRRSASVSKLPKSCRE
jgi:regulator of replication initiation timing